VLIDPLAARVRKRYPVGIATAKVIARESSFRVEPSTLFQPSTWRTHPPGFRNGISVEAGGPEDESFPPLPRRGVYPERAGKLPIQPDWPENLGYSSSAQSAGLAHRLRRRGMAGA